MSNRPRNLNELIGEIHDYNVDFSSRQIFLHQTDERPHIDMTVANMFLKNLILLDKAGDSPIVVHMSGLGGDWDCGMSIYDAISQSRCHVIGVGHGSIMSMHSIILQGCDERVAMPNCTFMLHEGSDSVDGTYKQAQSFLNIAPKRRQKIIDIYAERFKTGKYYQETKSGSASKTRAHIKQNFSKKEDWYLTSQEALEHGVIDKIVGVHVKNLYELICGSN